MEGSILEEGMILTTNDASRVRVISIEKNPKISWSGLLYGLNFPEPSPYSKKGLTDENIGIFNL